MTVENGKFDDLEISDVTLLSREEVENFLSGKNRFIDVSWWLRSSSPRDEEAALCVSPEGFIVSARVDEEHSVVPAIRVPSWYSLGVAVGQTITFRNEDWFVISNGLAVCTRPVGTARFREDAKTTNANIYELSDVRKWLEDWSLKKHICTISSAEWLHNR